MDIGNWVSGFFGQVGDLLSNVLNAVLLLLPDSPFVMLDKSEFTPLFKQINYFIPFQAMLGILEGWIVAVAVYMIYQVLLRWLKAIN